METTWRNILTVFECSVNSRALEVIPLKAGYFPGHLNQMYKKQKRKTDVTQFLSTFLRARSEKSTHRLIRVVKFPNSFGIGPLIRFPTSELRCFIIQQIYSIGQYIHTYTYM